MCDQAETIAREGPAIAENLPKSLRRAVEIERVPKDLRDDVRLIAEWLEQYMPQIKEIAQHLPETAEHVKEKVEPAVDHASKVSVSSGQVS